MKLQRITVLELRDGQLIAHRAWQIAKNPGRTKKKNRVIN